MRTNLRIAPLPALVAAALLTPLAVRAQSHQEHSRHTQPPTEEATEDRSDQSPVDHDAMDHGAMDHEQVDHGAMEHGDHPAPASTERPAYIQEPTAADRAAAFPDLGGMDMRDHMDDDPFVYMVLFDRLEWQDADEGDALVWDATSWFGYDRNRLWLRSEGERVDGHTESADLEALWGRPIARWWDLVAGVRQDFKPGDSQTWAAFGVVGLAPYKFEVEATAYLGESGRTAAELEAEYELLLTNRLILQPRAEATFYGKDDPERGVGAGLSELEVGLRLRYEIRREFAPYVGVEWGRVYGETADLARAEGEGIDDTRLVAGFRIWF